MRSSYAAKQVDKDLAQNTDGRFPVLVDNFETETTHKYIEYGGVEKHVCAG